MGRSGSATITFAQTGVQPPVYVVTSLSDPPWEPLEMKVESKLTASANNIFSRRFDHVPVGDHQYKIRIGHGHWVIDESKDTATDQHGNRNNVVRVKAAEHDEPRKQASELHTEQVPAAPAEEQTQGPHLSRKNVSWSGMAPHIPVPHIPAPHTSIPSPSAIVDKVADLVQPLNPIKAPHSLAGNEPTHAADHQPDLETAQKQAPAKTEASKAHEIPVPAVADLKTTLQQPPVKTETAKPPDVPALVVTGVDTTQKQSQDKTEIPKLPGVPLPVVADLETTHQQSQAKIETPKLPHVPLPVIAELETILKQPSVLAETLKSSVVPLVVPNIDKAHTQSPVNIETSKSSDVPLLVVEKTDNRPAYGDDFGEHATVSQKAAHDMRAADAAPNKLIVVPEGHVEPGTAEEKAAPLFPHESLQHVEPPTKLSSHPALDTIKEDSIDSSTDQSDSSKDLFNTPSESNDSRHEDSLPDRSGSRDAHEDELNHGPLLSHETGLNGSTVHPHHDDDEVDELDLAPLLSHETGFSQYTGSESTTNVGALEDDISEPRHYVYDDDDEDHGGEEDYNEDDAPLLPHERDSAITDDSGTEDGEPLFPYETDNSRVLFGGRERPSIFRARTNSSNLPHRLPETDEDDEDLNDPSLERFPTTREQILQRVATIGLQLPEDETIEDDIHSPVISVLSQACSSVDLAPAKSYTSLASVPEAGDSDEDEDDGDMESLPSPIGLNMSHATPQDRTATPTKVSNTLTPPLTPEIAENPSAAAPAELRHRQVSKPNTSADALADPPTQQLDQPNESFLQSFIRIVFGPLGRFLTACIGDRKRAGATILVAGVAVAWYVLAAT